MGALALSTPSTVFSVLYCKIYRVATVKWYPINSIVLVRQIYSTVSPSIMVVGSFKETNLQFILHVYIAELSPLRAVRHLHKVDRSLVLSRLEPPVRRRVVTVTVSSVAQLTSEKAVAEAYAGELKTALEEAYEYIEQLEEERCPIFCERKRYFVF